VEDERDCGRELISGDMVRKASISNDKGTTSVESKAVKLHYRQEHDEALTQPLGGTGDIT
jgi:hypothetical protein